MGLTFGDIAKMEQRLAKEGRLAETADVESLLKTFGEWFASTKHGDGRIVDSETFGLLCHYARTCNGEMVGSLAIGALRLAQREAINFPERARYTMRFALRRIRALTGENQLWSGIRLSEEEEEDAIALFEAAKGDTSYSEDELIASARAFIKEYKGEEYLYGRLAADLGILVNTIRDDNAETSHKEVARAALTYFAEVEDAIPDDLGLVGLLDDAFVVQRAVQEIHPARGTLASFLDEVVRHWPFVRYISLETSEHRYSLSEFMIANSALLLDKVCVEDGACGIALVVPEPGPLTFVMGFVRTLAEIRNHLGRDEWPIFQRGERLLNRGSRAEVFFEGYGRLIGTAFEHCAVEEATHFCFTTRPSKRGQSAAKCVRCIQDIASFRRSGKQNGSLKTGRVVFDRGREKMGSLERLFGTLKPIVLPAKRGRVIVVGPIGETRSIAQALSLFETPLVDVLPMGQSRLLGDEFEDQIWTEQKAGGVPMLTVVRSTSEAMAFAEESKDEILAVVASVKPGTTDPMNLARISAEEVPVVAILKENDTEGHEHLNVAGFKFWNWDERWFGSLRWSSKSAEDNHPIASYERCLQADLTSRVSVVTLEQPDIEKAYDALRNLEQFVKEEESELLEMMVGDGYSLLLAITRSVGPMTDEWMVRVQQRLSQLQQSVASSERWWSDSTIAVARCVVPALEQAVSALTVSNPKFEALVRWSNEHPGGAVICSQAMQACLVKHMKSKQTTFVSRIGSWQHFQYSAVPAWLNRERMERLLFPPVSLDMTLLLYMPEVEWYRASLRRRKVRLQKIRTIASQRTPFKKLRCEVQKSKLDDRTVQDPCPYDVVVKAQRAHVVRYLGSIEGETVQAHLIHFAGGHWASFTPQHRLHTVTHLLGSDATADEESEIKEVTAPEIRVGDLVLLLRGSDRDALRDAVDSEAPSGMREIAAVWQQALRSFVDSGCTIESLIDRLEQQGCRRTTATIQRWVEDEMIIGPQKTRSDIESILRATGDKKLGESLDRCIEAITQLRGLHHSVARRLAKRVIARARQWLDSGALPDELVEVEDRLVLVAVDSVDRNLVDVPRSAVNRLQEERWL